MKKMMLAVLMLSMCYTISAQSDSQQNKKMKFGVKAGVNFANATGNGVDLFTDGKSSSTRLGLSLGVLLEYEISDKFFLQPELLYSQQGFKTGIADGVVKLDYINIPILAKYYMSDNFSLEVGPQIGFLLSSKYNSKGQGDIITDRREAKRTLLDEVDLKEFFKKTDFGLNFGLNYQLKNGLGFNTRYNLGLKDIFDFERREIILMKALADDDYEIKNNVFQLSVFYTF